jgi:protein-S-isoprenylcysteine O-methyltransferase Ste14
MRPLDHAERLARFATGLLALVALGSTVPGIVRAARDTGVSSGHPERVFSPVPIVFITLGWLAAATAAWRPLPLTLGPARRWALLVFGLGACVAGLSTALLARLELGTSYRPSSTLGARLGPSHRLVTTGPFAAVRHPMYLGLVLAAIGALALYRTWTTLLFVLQLPVLVVRARREEKLLDRVFGASWRAYAGRVPAWLPGRRALPAPDQD